MIRRLATVLLAGLLLGGCASVVPDRAVAPSASPDNAEPVRATPTEIYIPKIAAHSSLIPTGLDAEENPETPPVTQPKQASWYELGASAGENGNVIVLGHVDGEIGGKKGQPGVFFKLKQLVKGDTFTIIRSDAKQVKFAVTEVLQVPKGSAFPKQRVYGATNEPGAVLITCTGKFDHNAKRYEDNLVVFAAEI